MRDAPTPESTPANDAEGRAERRRMLRRQLVDRRLAINDEAIAAWSARICTHLQDTFPQLATRRVAFCWPVKKEPDLRPLICSWIAAGHPDFTALLPVVVEAEAPLAFRAWTPDCAMRADCYGIPTPDGGDLLEPQALLLPLNGFDARGYRLGYGGGFFDRTLAALQPRPLVIGVGFEIARVDTIAPETHDIRMDWIVSEAGAFRPTAA